MASLTYKPIPEQFTRHGFIYTKIKREGDVAIYSQRKGDSQRFEVVIIQRHNGREIAGNKIEPAEFFPSSSEWGSKGWTCIDRGRAEERFSSLLAEIQQKKEQSEINLN